MSGLRPGPRIPLNEVQGPINIDQRAVKVKFFQAGAFVSSLGQRREGTWKIGTSLLLLVSRDARREPLKVSSRLDLGAAFRADAGNIAGQVIAASDTQALLQPIASTMTQMMNERE